MVATSAYMNDQNDQKLLPWYQYPAHQGYAFSLYTPWVFGGFKAPDPGVIVAGGTGADAHHYPARIRPLNKYVDASAVGDNDVIELYKCPSDRTNSTPTIGAAAINVTEERVSSWARNGSSFTLNTRFMQGYEANNGGNFDLTKQDKYALKIASHMVGGDAARFIIWEEQGFYSATYRAMPTLPNGAPPLRSGWHRRFSTWSLGFADGHAVHTYYDTRLTATPAGTIWQPGFDPATDL